MSESVHRALSWGAVALVVSGVLGMALLESHTPDTILNEVSSVFTNLLYGSAVAASTIMGALILHRRPGHVVGWLLVANGALLTLSGLVDDYAAYAFHRPGQQIGEQVSAAYYTHGWPPLFASIVAIAFVFPDGRLLTRRWRAVAAGGALSFVVTFVAGMLGPDPLDAPFGEVEPIAILPAGIAATLTGLGLLGMLATLVLAMVSLVLRFRRSSGLERLQLKWVALAGVLIPVAIVCGIVDGFAQGTPGFLTWISAGLMLIGIPVAIGVAVLRYRLYDIDRFISATVLYGVLTLVLGSAFVAIVVSGGVWLGRGSPVPTALATVAVMLAFRPLRARLQRGVDRRFNRQRYDALRSLETFLDDLRAGRAAPEDVGTVIAAAVGDPSLRVFFWFDDQDGHVDSGGATVDPLPDEPPSRTPVVRGQELVATVVHGAVEAERSGLLADLLHRAGLALEIARLRVEVRRQLTEVEESRARIVTAGQEERRRLERDLHDGAQQRLVSVGLDLRHLQQQLPSGAVRDSLDETVSDLAEAITDLRRLAQGVRPNALDAGLAPALAQLAARATIRTEVDVTRERFSDAVEAAAYFVASEALTNAVKHSGASVVTMTAERADDQLRMVIADDGVGGALPGRGSGLTGLADRVAAVGGRLAVASRDGTGTRLEAVFPCA